MTEKKLSKTLTALVAAALITAGCGESSDSATVQTVAPGAPSTTGVPEMPDQQTPPARLVVDVLIKGAEVTPTNAALEARVSQPIVIKVNSDVADQLHVHSTPEHTFTVEPKNNQSFQFTVDVPGKVDVELHDLNKIIATITVLQ